MWKTDIKDKELILLSKSVQCIYKLYVLPGQLVQQSLQLITYESDQATFDVVIGYINHEDVGRRIRRLVVLWVEKAADGIM